MTTRDDDQITTIHLADNRVPWVMVGLAIAVFVVSVAGGLLLYLVLENKSTINALQGQLAADRQTQQAQLRLIQGLQGQVRDLCQGRKGCVPLSVAPPTSRTPLPSPRPTAVQPVTPTTTAPLPQHTSHPLPRSSPRATGSPPVSPSSSPTPSASSHLAQVCVGTICTTIK